MLGAIASVGGGIWLSTEAILNQDVAFWLSQALPQSNRSEPKGKNLPQTLEQIRAAMRSRGELPGEAVSLTSSLTGTRDLLIPVLQQADCEVDCQAIGELRVYRSLKLPFLLHLLSAEQYFWRVDQMVLEGPEESQIVTPLGNQKLANYGSTQALPLTELEQYAPVTAAGVWLNLAGLSKGESYGQILYYSPDQARLHLILNWSSPTGDGPSWQAVTGGGTSELVVNQTVGFEPEFTVYQVQPGNPMKFQAIALEPAAEDQTYLNSLILARSRLWSLASARLKFNHGSKAVQAQIDFIRFHARFAQAQAEQFWMSSAQKTLAYLIDGRFTEALQVFQASEENIYEVGNMLQTDGDRLWNRVTAALEVNPAQPDVLMWGVLILAAQQGKPEALAWLREREAMTSSVYAQALKLLKRLDNAKVKFQQPLSPGRSPKAPHPTPVSAPPPPEAPRSSKQKLPQAPQSTKLQKSPAPRLTPPAPLKRKPAPTERAEASSQPAKPQSLDSLEPNGELSKRQPRATTPTQEPLSVPPESP